MNMRSTLSPILISIFLLLSTPIVSHGQTLQWGPTNGPYGSVCQDLVMTSSGTYLLNDERNGVWRSTDAGMHWQRSSTGLSIYGVYALAIAADGNVLAATYYGVNRSTDDGKSWVSSNTGITQQNLEDILALSDGTVLATAWGGGLFRSTNNGQLWTEVTPGPAELRIYCLRKTAADHVFAGSFGAGVFRSTDKGLTWTALSLGGYVYDMAQTPDGMLHALRSDVGLFHSSDNGDTWYKSDDGLPYFRGYGFASRSAGELFFGCSIPQGMYRSTDAGATWAVYSDGFSNAITQGMFRVANGDLLAMTNGDGVYCLPKDSSVWSAWNEGMQGTWIRAVAVAPDGSIAAGGYGGVSISRDEGASWTNAGSGVKSSLVYDLLWINQTLLAAGYPGGVCRSTDFGVHWIPINSGQTSDRPTCLSLDASGTLFCGTDGKGVFSSSDNGDTWVAINDGLTSLRVYALCEDATAIYTATDDGVFKSTNQGANWFLASSGLPTSHGNALLSVNNLLFVSVGGGVYRSSDGGTNWSRSGLNQLPSRAFETLKASSSGLIFAGGDVGIYATSDGGENWQYVGDGLPNNTTYDIAFDSAGKLYAAIYGNGVFRSPPLNSGPEVTITTSPAGRSFTVDGMAYTTTQTFNWQPGTTHEIGTEWTQYGQTGIRYVYSGWTDGGDVSHMITAPMGAQTITANFRTEYQLLVATDGAGTVTPQSGWYNPGAQAELLATPEAGQTFLRWEGTGSGSYTGTNNPATVTLNNPVTQTAYFSGNAAGREITVTTAPSGRRVTVDGQDYSNRTTFTWNVGSSHQISTASPQQGSPGIRYVWNSWSNAQPMTHTYVVAAGPAVELTANFDMEYSLTMTAGTGGTVSPGTSWHGTGTRVQIRATPQGGYEFDRWVGSGVSSYSGTDNPATVTITNAITENAVFRQVTDVRDDPSMPRTMQLEQNAPNPCASFTVFSFVLPRAQAVSLVVTDLLGRECARVCDRRTFPAGAQRIGFDASVLRPGVYLYRLESAGETRSGRMIVIR
ncbi:MAG: T9SS type A sorting domain-containing protein [Bacteroidetes bacterium]|nr:T9SS type A sorting domain-containing protein [Bacteroidota bacterium]